MKEFYNRANWANQQYEAAMDQVWRSFFDQQQTAWNIAQANASVRAAAIGESDRATEG